MSDKLTIYLPGKIISVLGFDNPEKLEGEDPDYVEYREAAWSAPWISKGKGTSVKFTASPAAVRRLREHAAHWAYMLRTDGDKDAEARAEIRALETTVRRCDEALAKGEEGGPK